MVATTITMATVVSIKSLMSFLVIWVSILSWVLLPPLHRLPQGRVGKIAERLHVCIEGHAMGAALFHITQSGQRAQCLGVKSMFFGVLIDCGDVGADCCSIKFFALEFPEVEIEPELLVAGEISAEADLVHVWKPALENCC